MLPATRNPTYNFIVIYSQLDHQPAEPQPRRLDRQPRPHRAEIAIAQRPAGADIPLYYSRPVFVYHEPPGLSPGQTTLTPSRSKCSQHQAEALRRPRMRPERGVNPS